MGWVALDLMSDLVFEDLPLTRWSCADRHPDHQHDSRTTSSAALYRLAEVVIDPLCTSVARTVGEKACGPHRLDGRVGRARPEPRDGKGVNALRRTKQEANF